MAVVEVQFYVGTPTSLWGDGYIVASQPLGEHFSKAEITDYFQSSTIPSGWSSLDESEQDGIRYTLNRTKQLTNNSAVTIATRLFGVAYTSGTPEEKASMEADAQAIKDAAQTHRDRWVGTGPNLGVGLDTNWGYRDLSGQFGVVLVNVPNSFRYHKDFDPGGAGRTLDTRYSSRAPINHGADPVLPKQHLGVTRYRMPYESLGIAQGVIDDWKDDGTYVDVDRGMTPFTVAQIKGAIP